MWKNKRSWQEKLSLQIKVVVEICLILYSVVNILVEVWTGAEYIYAERLSLIDFETKIAALLALLILANSKFVQKFQPRNTF